MDANQRIANFENMAKADPTNEMAHFSLAGAYAQAGRHSDAAASYLKAAELNPDVTKAFQLAGECLIKAGDRERAAQALTKGYEQATLRGDLMPRNAIAKLLGELGRPVPKIAGAAEASTDAAPSGFVCQRTGRPGVQMEKPPFRGPVGAWIRENISAQTWDEWIRQGTKVINELRLDLSRDQDAETYDRYMREYLGIDDALLARLRGGAE